MKFRPLQPGEVEFKVGVHDRREPDADNLRLVANDQVGLAPAQEQGLSFGVDRQSRVIVDPVRGEPGHVALVAVGVSGDDPDLPRAGLVQANAGRFDGD